jgi:hypothetical protein
LPCRAGKDSATHLDAGKSHRSSIPIMAVTLHVCKNSENRDDPQPTWLPDSKLRGSTLAKVWVHILDLRYGLRPLERARPSTFPHGVERWPGQLSTKMVGTTELACGSQAFIATLLFDPSMSALPIIPKQNSVSVGLFTH